MVSVFPDDRVENLTAANTSPPPEGQAGSVIFLIENPSLAQMAFHGNLQQGMFERGPESERMPSLYHPARAHFLTCNTGNPFRLFFRDQEMYQSPKKFI